jgi:hypothetical protein
MGDRQAVLYITNQVGDTWTERIEPDEAVAFGSSCAASRSGERL